MQEFKGVIIPVTGEDWQLYTCSMKCGTAARGLTAALKRAFKHFEKNMGRDGKSAAETLGDAYKLVGEAMGKYSKFGACDTEPRGVAKQALIDLAKLKIYGSTDEYHPELGDWM